ncbi:MAG: hypothetical protein Q4B34_00935 [Candidatus Saccharibacteria bacterium]|nr:hypothetical protein [Candidatus Saccharibacteria bacterium]
MDAGGVQLERKLLDRRFREKEIEIIRLFLTEGTWETAIFVRRVGVSRATFYRHHQGVGRIVPDYREMVMVRFERMLERVSGEKLAIRDLCLRFLTFILQNREIFRMFLAVSEYEVYILMFRRIWGEERILMAELVVLIEDWGKRGFLEVEIDEILGKMVKIVRGRLALGGCKC